MTRFQTMIETLGLSDWKNDLKELGHLGGPVVLANAFRLVFLATNTIFLGRLPNAKEALSGFTLANSWIAISVYFGVGIVFALDTFVSQAYGAKNYKLIGTVFQNCLVVVTIISIPTAVSYWFTEPMLLALKQGEEVSRLAGEFAKWSIPGMVSKIFFLASLWLMGEWKPGVLPYFFYRAIMRYLQNQHIMMPAVYVGVIGVVLNLVLSWILVLGIGGWSGLGFIGAPIATSLTYISHPIMLWSYVIWAGAHKNTWFGWSKEFVASDSSRVLLVILTPDCRAVSPRMLWEFLKIGIPSAVMLIIEVVGMEIVTLMLGSFKDEIALSAHNISQSLTGFVWTISAGISNGAATKVGNLLGERNHVKAKQFGTFCTIATTLMSFIVMSLYMALKGVLPRIYTNEEDVIAYTSYLLPIPILVILFDAIGTVGSAIVRGIGRPLPGSIINFVGFYIFCIPVGAGLAFGANLAAFGLWWGIFAGLAASCACYYVFLYIIVDWKEEERKAVLRVSEETGMTPLPETLDEESSGLIQDIDLIDNDESDEE